MKHLKKQHLLLRILMIFLIKKFFDPLNNDHFFLVPRVAVVHRFWLYLYLVFILHKKYAQLHLNESKSWGKNYNFWHWKFLNIIMRKRTFVTLLLFCHISLVFSSKIRVLKFNPTNESDYQDKLQVKIEIDPQKNYSKVKNFFSK